MNCNEIENKLIKYVNEEISYSDKKKIEEHLHSCKGCFKIYSELQTTLSLTDKRRGLKPNPFLYTRVKHKLEGMEGVRKKSITVQIFNKIAQPVMVSFLLFIAIFSGIKIGDSYKTNGSSRIVISKTTEFYLDDIQQERLEATLLND